MNNNIEYTIEPKSNFSLNLSELVQYRELFYFFTWRDVKVKYKQAFLGVLWVLLQPLAMITIFTFIFSRVFNVNTNGIPYPLFALSGLIIWNVFSAGLTSSANSMVNNANIIKKIYFPRLVIPISSILSVLIDFSISLLFYFAVLIFYNEYVNWLNLMWCLPLALSLILMTTFGLGTLIASLNVKYRDFQYLLPFFIQFMMFLNPILYPTQAVSNPIIKTLMIFNPIATAIDIQRAVLVGNEIDFSQIIIGFVVAMGLLMIGIYTFRKTEDYFADLA